VSFSPYAEQPTSLRRALLSSLRWTSALEPWPSSSPPYLGEWVHAAAGVIVIGSLPVLGLNIARVARREWDRHSLPR
jgi:hypothetical protein